MVSKEKQLADLCNRYARANELLPAALASATALYIANDDQTISFKVLAEEAWEMAFRLAEIGNVEADEYYIELKEGNADKLPPVNDVVFNAILVEDVSHMYPSSTAKKVTKQTPVQIKFPGVVVAIDQAGPGQDHTVIAMRQGDNIIGHWTIKGLPR